MVESDIFWGSLFDHFFVLSVLLLEVPPKQVLCIFFTAARERGVALAALGRELLARLPGRLPGRPAGPFGTAFGVNRPPVATH